MPRIKEFSSVMKSNPNNLNQMSGSRINSNRASTALDTNETVRNRLKLK